MPEIPVEGVVALQARLVAPAYQSGGKWILLNPKSRRMFAVSDKDAPAAAIRVLGALARGELPPSDVSEKEVHSLRSSGLIHHQEPSDQGASFIDSYQQLLYDYPYTNYRGVDWRADDSALMDSYAALWLPPSRTTARVGERINLPVSSGPTSDGELTLEHLAYVLRFSVGSMGLMKRRYGPFLHKTSPSGGARHPTECRLIVSSPWAGLRPGVWDYLVEDHQLVRTEDVPAPLLSSGELPYFLITSRVERPMWRYRDPRSFRPVLIDAGHVVETLGLLLRAVGASPEITSAPKYDESLALNWPQEPWLCTVRLGAATRTAVPELKNKVQDAGVYYTNPVCYLLWTASGTIVKIDWPTSKSHFLSDEGLAVLTHCMPSRRRDRDVSTEGIQEATGVSDEELKELLTDGFLVERGLATRFLNELDLWSRHDWYLSFLAHLESNSHAAKQTILETSERFSVTGGQVDALTDVLVRRKTTRDFLSLGQPVGSLQSLWEALQPTPPDVELFVTALNVEGLHPGVYRWTGPQDFSWVADSTREVIRDAAIGQPWTGRGDFVLWVVADLMNAKSFGAYELVQIALGALGQRACLWATAHGLGVFESPAVNDAVTTKMLDLEHPDRTAGYSIHIGSIDPDNSR